MAQSVTAATHRRSFSAPVISSPNSIVSSNDAIPFLPKVPMPSLEGRVQVVDTPKIESPDVFNTIRSKMCMVIGPNKKTSGFFINEHGLLATVFHCLTQSYDPSELTVIYEGKNYKVKFPDNFNRENALASDLCLLQIEGISTSCFDLLPPTIRIQEGMKTYFAGFPLTQEIITFHKGLISSIYQANGKQYFTIDGTVVPGNSGGPVVIQHQNNVYLAGVVYAEAADVNPDFLQQKKNIVDVLQNATVNISGVHLNKILAHAVDTMFKNMSTGIGKAIHVQHIAELISDQTAAYYLIGPEQPHIPGSELVVHGTLKVECSSKEAIVKYKNAIVYNAINFIESFKSTDQKKDFYSKLWGLPGNIYNFEGGRIDKQAPPADATNVQIQVGNHTIATLKISNDLGNYDNNPGKIAEVVNYVKWQFRIALMHYQKHGEAIVLTITKK